MADQAEAGSRDEEDGETREEIKDKKDKVEEVKKKRGRPAKTKMGEKGEGKGAGNLLKYLEEKKIAGDTTDGFIEKGRELKRTPVKQLTAEGTTAVNKEGGNEGTEEEMAAAQQKVRLTSGKDGSKGDQKSELGADQDAAEDTEQDADREAEEEDERENNVEVSAGMSAGMSVWMREIGDRLKATEVGVKELKEKLESKDEEIKQFKSENRCRDIVIEGLNRRVGELKEIIRDMADRIEELEREKAERMGRVGGEGIVETSKDRVVSEEDSESSAESANKASSGEAGIIRGGGGVIAESGLSEEERSRRALGGGAVSVERNDVVSIGGTERESECGVSGVSEERSEVPKRDYLKCIPTALNVSEFNCEMEERKKRKKNIKIRGIRTVGKGIREEVKSVIKKLLGIDIYIAKVMAVGGGLVVELESFENKIDVLKRRGMLKGINLWIEDDYTERENEVQEWLLKIEKEERARGNEVKVGYQKIRVNGEWYRWEEKKGG